MGDTVSHTVGATNVTPETLDPQDWRALRALSHRMVDDAIDYVAGVRDRPIWQPMPDSVRDYFDTPLPKDPQPLDRVYRELSENLMPYPMGNIHPRFWGWYMGAGNFTGALGDFLAAVVGSNLGGGDHAATRVEQQLIGWLKDMVGFPATAGGTLTSGGSMANLIGLAVARNVQSGGQIRETGVADAGSTMVFYASDQVHGCHCKALEILGHGNLALRKLPTDGRLRMDTHALRRAIAADRGAGLQPACVIATAGTVNTGAIDDLPGIAKICREEGLWFHVDGCIGALLAIAPDNAWRVATIEQADSIALDPHKWLHAPFDVGCVLTRDREAHFETFTLDQEYLQKTERGLAAGDWLYEYGPQTSRGFRALKVWMALKEHGVEKFGRLIDQDVAHAKYLAALIGDETDLAMVAAPTINIVCFRFDPGQLGEQHLKRINTEIMLRMQESGFAILSDTTVSGRHCLRVAINNHRTRQSDLDRLVGEVLRLGRDIA